mmetsp:Transcript_4705/g.14718  ORF Transcript_4705/g.14718 Transcript_4705/m.14718 type:complete len:657 (+) Transcript_4705:132-2102(+)
MTDQLVPADASQALALADARHEQALATLDDSKRRVRWPGQSAPKRGKRWGLAEDRPFKPLPYVDLPVGLAEAEVDQFLREQRLEDLHRKIQLHQLEDVEPDIRPPSPPPLYDRAGNRLNTREVRIRKAMIAEYNRLVRHMVKTVEGYVPPPDWRPQKLIKKIIIPYERFPQAPFMGVIIGARGVNHKRLQETTGCRIFIRGRDIGDRWQTDEELQMLQHVHIEADTEEQIAAAEKLILPLLDPESPEFEYARTHGMQQLAVVNGFTLKRTEQRCGVCGAVGHLGFECPETGGLNYKMANVVCTICGDKGHVSSDCKLAAEKREKEQADWKAEAERRQGLEAEYGRMMSELGLSPPPAGAPPPLRPNLSAGRGGALRGGLLRGSTATAARPTSALLALPALPAAPPQPRPLQPRPLQPQPQPVPSRPPPWAAAPAVAATSSARTPARPAAPLSPAMLAPRQPMIPAPRVAPAAPAAVDVPLQPVTFVREGAIYAAAQPPVAASLPTVAIPCMPVGDADESLSCPAVLEAALHGGTLAEVAQETGAAISLGPPEPGGGRRFRIQGPAEARERAKLHLQAWMDVNLLSAGISPVGAPLLAESPPPPPWLLLAPGGPPPGLPLGFPPPCSGGGGMIPPVPEAGTGVGLWQGLSADAFEEL